MTVLYSLSRLLFRGLIIKNVTVDDGGSYKCKATQSDFGITDFRDLVIHLKIEREFDICHILLKLKHY